MPNRHKEGGVEWIDVIPADWEVKRLRFAMKKIEQGWSPLCHNQKAENDEWGVLKVGCVNGATFDPSQNKALPSDLEPRVQYEIRSGDILMSRANTKDLLGSAAIVKDVRPRLLLCDKLYRLIVSDQIDREYAVFAMRTHAARFQYERAATGASGSMQNIGQDTIKDLLIALPPLPEQRALVVFLQRETARIDALVAKKRRLLELLEEKRLAVITHAVTKGLDPNAPMKDSGIDWLGQIPAHWDAKRLKFVSPKVTVGIVVTPAAYYVEAGIPALRGFNIKERHIDLSDLAFISEEANDLHAKSKIYRGDLVAVRTGQPGTTAVVPQALDGANCVDLIIIRRSPDVMPEFAAYFANSDPAKMQYGAGAEGALQQHFNIDTAKNLLVPIPPLPEQRAIVDHLVSEEGKFRHAMSTMQRSVDTLTEYRSALITSAVTGKIDVRGAAERKEAAE
jgi:type I restriction enzyme S subunit